MQSTIPFENYVGPVRANAQSALVLARRLEKAAPEDLTAHERRALSRVSEAAEAVQEIQSARERFAPIKLRPLLAALASDWAALEGALAAAARLAPELGDLGARAGRVLATLLPDGTSFTQRAAPAAWSEANRRLDRLREEDLDDEVVALVGRPFLDAVKRSTARLGDAIGVGRVPAPVASPTALAEALLEFGAAVGAYGRVLAGAVSDEKDDGQTRRFLAAVAPVDQHRAENRPSAPPEADTEPAAPAFDGPFIVPPGEPVPSPAS